MKISRVYIYLKFKNLLASLFLNFSSSKNKLSKKLLMMTNKKYIEYFGMCRTTLIVMLEYLKEIKPDKNEIIVCSYNLREMIDIIKNYNFKINLVDINKHNGLINSDFIKEKISQRTAALLYTNMFNDYESARYIKRICEQNDILLIEDCAIYFGNYSIENNKKIYAGSIGDVSIFSFGIMKNICAIFGGALVTSNNDIYNYAIKKENEYKKFSNFLYFKKILLFLVLKISTSKFFYNYFFFYLIKIATIKKFKPLLNIFYPALKFKSKINLPDNYYSKISNLSLKIASHYIQGNDFEIETEARKKNNKIYQKYFENQKNVKVLKINDFDYQNFLDYPIFVESRNDLVNYLLNRGLETRIHFYSNCEDVRGDLANNKNSQEFEDQIICLPSHSKISHNKIREYCSSISDFYGSNN